MTIKKVPANWSMRDVCWKSLGNSGSPPSSLSEQDLLNAALNHAVSMGGGGGGGGGGAGATAAGCDIQYLFNPETSGDPGDGHLSFDNALPNLAETITISEKDASGAGVNPLLTTLGVGAVVRITGGSDPAGVIYGVLFDAPEYDPFGEYWYLYVNVIGGSSIALVAEMPVCTSFYANTPTLVPFIVNGTPNSVLDTHQINFNTPDFSVTNAGAGAASVALLPKAAVAGGGMFAYNFSTNTAATDPGVGFLKFNTPSQLENATVMCINYTSSAGTAKSGINLMLGLGFAGLLKAVGGYIIVKNNVWDVYCVFVITSVVDSGAFATVGVDCISNSQINVAIASNGDPVHVWVLWPTSNIPTFTPATATAAGVAGTISKDAGYLYVCTATNTWKRVAIAAW